MDKKVRLLVSLERKVKQDLDSAIEKAVDFHGHLGPFLVVGVRMGITALQRLETRKGDAALRAVVSVKRSVPFSCAIDGIQVTTRCTIGNGRLRLRNSSREISTTLEISGRRRVTVTLKPAKLAELRRAVTKMKVSERLEAIARAVASMPEQELFIIRE